MVLLMQLMFAALFLARPKAGNNIAARIAMIAMTTSNSINVNAASDQRPSKPVRDEGDGAFLGFMRVTLTQSEAASSGDSDGNPAPALFDKKMDDRKIGIGQARKLMTRK